MSESRPDAKYDIHKEDNLINDRFAQAATTTVRLENRPTSDRKRNQSDT